MAAFLKTLGSVLRSTGKAIDSLGLGLQGSLGFKETRECRGDPHAESEDFGGLPALRVRGCQGCRRLSEWTTGPPPPVAAVNKAQTVLPYAGAKPTIGDQVFIAPSASVIGNVTLGSGSSVWYGTVLRGETWFV